MDQLSTATEPLEVLLRQARAGDQVALGRLLESYHTYLRLLAGTLIGAALRVRLDAADLVQETYLEALRDFPHFAGGSEQELLSWLRQILVRNLADQVRRHQSQGRDWRRQQSLDELLEHQSQAVPLALADSVTTPSTKAMEREQAVLVADALARLDPDYREVILLRHVEHLPFEEVARRMGRSAGAVRMLWARALEKLSSLLGGSHEF